MGYHVDTWGEFRVEPEMSPGHIKLFNYYSRKKESWSARWVVNEKGTLLEWEDDFNKIQPDPEILEYLIQKYLKLWGYLLFGEVQYQGEAERDKGTIKIQSNRIVFMRKI